MTERHEVESLFESINLSGADHWEIRGFQAASDRGQFLLWIDCNFSDCQAHNRMFEVRFFDVEYLACSTIILDGTFRLATEADWQHVRKMVNFSELTGESKLYCINTNLNWQPRSEKDIDTYYILAKRVEVVNLRAGKDEA